MQLVIHDHIWIPHSVFILLFHLCCHFLENLIRIFLFILFLLSKCINFCQHMNDISEIIDLINRVKHLIISY